jgi:L-fucose mutarotase
MLKSKLIHPDILSTLGRAGHGSKILIADGNYPFATRLGPKAALISLNLMPGLVSCTQILEALLSAVPIEAAAVMEPPKTGPYAMQEDPSIWGEFRHIMKDFGVNVELERVERFKFYELASSDEVALTVASGDQRVYANLLLTIGVVTP